MGLFSSPDPPAPPPPLPDPEPPKQDDKDVQAAGEKARRTAQRRGRSTTILTTQTGKDQEALGKGRSSRKRKTKLGGA